MPATAGLAGCETHVEISHPLAGLIVRYSGGLTETDAAAIDRAA